MKTFIKIGIITSVVFLLTNCSTADLVDYWKNPDIDSLAVNKVLIVGMTPNYKARDLFEQKLKLEYEKRGIDAVASLDIFDSNYTFEDKSEKEIKTIENVLTANFFDAVIFTKVKGIENKEVYDRKFREKEHLDIRFKEDYGNHEMILNDPKYYDKYTIYHVETSLYCICPTKDRELIWKGSIDITDPTKVNETINDYVTVLVAALEEFNLLPEEKK